MRLSKIFENHFKNMKVIYVKLKSDPANKQLPYEGYMLNENEDGTIDMVVTTPGCDQDVITVSPDQIDFNQTLTNVEKLKLIIAGMIKDKNLLMQIKELNTVTDIEAMLIANGHTFEDLYEIFKTFFLIHG